MESRQVVFLGVSTKGSVASAAFPAWSRLVGLGGALLHTVDLPPRTPRGQYRHLLARMRTDRRIAGAVITGHKTAIVTHAGDLLDDLEPAARITAEASVIYRSGERLIGTLIEPASIRTTLGEMLAPDHWEHADDLVVFGAGGTAAALALCLFGRRYQGSRRDRPRHVKAYDIDAERLEALAGLFDRLDADAELSLHVAGDDPGEDPFAGLGPGALVVNATGLGKDRPGAPLPLPAAWPTQAVVWELNYRGERPFLKDAEAQAPYRDLRVFDGWRLFVHGWAEALSRIVGRPLAAQEIAALDRAAVLARHGG